MKRIVTAAALAALAGCGTTSPSIYADFPLLYLMDVETAGAPANCCFLEGQGDALASAGKNLFFLDLDAGYVKGLAEFPSAVDHAASSPDGGYGLAITGDTLRVVSNQTYIERAPVALPGPGAFILPKPQSVLVAVLCLDGTAVKVSTVDWAVTASGQTGVQNPTAAAMSPDGRYIFAGNSSGQVYRISMVDLSGELMFQAPGAVTDIAPGPGQNLCMTAEGMSQVWVVDVNSGLHSGGYDIPGSGTAVCITGDGKYVFAAVPGYGIVVVNVLDNTVAAQTEAFGTPADMAVNSVSNRAVVASPETGRVFMLQR